MKQRLDQHLVAHGNATTRSQAANLVRMGRVFVAGQVITKAGYLVAPGQTVQVKSAERYVSRAGFKLASVAGALGVDFVGKHVLDVGSSTGGFTDYALQHGAARVVAVDVGTEQLHPNLRGDERIELHEKTDIRDFIPNDVPDIVVMDVSFISLRQILPHIARISGQQAAVVAMVKPQFEARRDQLTKTGIVKNDRARRSILQDFETWVKRYYIIEQKADSEVKGEHGNHERFYLMKPLAKSAIK